MAVVIAALLPVFLLIVLGFILKRTLIRPETQWHGLERLTYYVLFPVCWCRRWSRRSDRAGAASAARCCCGARDVAAVLRCAPARPRLGRWSAFTSIFQGATRWQTYVALLSPAACSAISDWRWLGRDGRHRPDGQRVQRRGAGPLRFAEKRSAAHRHDRGAQSADLGLRDRAGAQRRPHPAAQTLA